MFPDGGRLHAPVQLDVGPVLHQDDLAADKVLAMWGRGEPRDYLDVTALLERYGGDALLTLASQKDRGLTTSTFLVSLQAVSRLEEADWADAGVSPERASHITKAILGWREQLDS